MFPQVGWTVSRVIMNKVLDHLAISIVFLPSTKIKLRVKYFFSTSGLSHNQIAPSVYKRVMNGTCVCVISWFIG